MASCYNGRGDRRPCWQLVKSGLTLGQVCARLWRKGAGLAVKRRFRGAVTLIRVSGLRDFWPRDSQPRDLKSCFDCIYDSNGEAAENQPIASFAKLFPCTCDGEAFRCAFVAPVLYALASREICRVVQPQKCGTLLERHVMECERLPRAQQASIPRSVSASRNAAQSC